MTDTETTVTVVEAFNPYDSSDNQNYYTNRAWDSGKQSRKRNDNAHEDTVPDTNPWSDGEHADRHKAWQEGYEGTGLSGSLFTHPIPVKGDGTFIFPDITTMEDPLSLTRRAVPTMVWAYDEWSDKQEPKVRPIWARFPVHARCIVLADGHAWSAASRWMSNSEIRGTKTYELPCPPYNFEVDGSRLVISAGFFSKGGSKKEWTQVLETMQAEVDDMPDGFYMGDDYLNVTVSARVTGSLSIPASSLLSGHENLDEDEWIGTDDEYHDAVVEALDDYDWSYEVSDMEIDTDYADWEVEDTDTSDLSTA